MIWFCGLSTSRMSMSSVSGFGGGGGLYLMPAERDFERSLEMTRSFLGRVAELEPPVETSILDGLASCAGRLVEKRISASRLAQGRMQFMGEKTAGARSCLKNLPPA